MFRLHETTRRRICCSAFVVLSVIPTLAVTAWVLYWHRPGRLRDQERRIGGLLHAQAKLADWREPRPGTARISGLVVTSPSTGDRLIEIKGLELERASVGTLITIDDVVVGADGMEALIAKARDWLGALPVNELHLNLKRLTVTAAAGGQVALRDVQLRASRGARAVTKAQLAAYVGGNGNDGEILRLSWEQSASGANAAVRATIDASEAPLPAWVFSSGVPSFAGLGPDARFRGAVRVEDAGNQLRGVAHGHIEGIALAGLLPPRSSHAAQGQAELALDELRWCDRTIERMAGKVHIDRGKISRSLVDAAVDNLGCGYVAAGAASRGAAASELVEIDALACQFQLDHAGLAIWGELPAQGSMHDGGLAASRGRPLLMQPRYLLPASAWVQFVAGPPSYSWAPATQEAVDILRHLPLPRTGEAKQPTP